jgi:hypothetical protein
MKLNKMLRFTALVNFTILIMAGLVINGLCVENPLQKEQSFANNGGVDKKSESDKINKIVVYYFHGNARCPTCFKLENYAKTEVETDFANEIKAGKLEWKTINVEEKGNEHFENDYKLYTKSVIISICKGNKEVSWKNLEKIWQLVQDESKYRQYIKSEVMTCLEGKN